MSDRVLRHKRLHSGYRYELIDEWKAYYNNGNNFSVKFNKFKGGYCYAEAARYVDGCETGDCWIVDVKGKVHPGFKNYPMPHHISSLVNPVKIDRAKG